MIHYFPLTREKKFKYEKEAILLLRYISGSQKEIDYKYGDESIFGEQIKFVLKKNQEYLLLKFGFYLLIILMRYLFV